VGFHALEALAHTLGRSVQLLAGPVHEAKSPTVAGGEEMQRPPRARGGVEPGSQAASAQAAMDAVVAIPKAPADVASPHPLPRANGHRGAAELLPDRSPRIPKLLVGPLPMLTGAAGCRTR